MPALDWIGKDAVVRHHAEVPFHALRVDDSLSVGSESANLLVEGDNLVALKALLPHVAGRVKCIYIDPPYNTGNESWTYNDNVNSPEIKEWLGRVVGAEAEDLSRHDKWLCMMYPRLRLLREFLCRDGAIFVSIDDNEVHHLRQLMDEVFGPRNFVATIIWQKIFSPKNSARQLSTSHDYILVYARDGTSWQPRLLPRLGEQDARYSNPDNDPRGPWMSSDLSARNFYSLGTYPITTPSGRVIPGPPTGRYWTVSEPNFKALVDDNRVWFGTSGSNVARLKRFLSEVKQGVVPQTLWLYDNVGHTQEAKQELVAALDFPDSASVFVTPKPTRLLKRIIQIATDDDSIVLDSFAGSGTTGAAVLQINAETGSRRRFILVEVDSTIARTVAAERLRRIADGYTAKRSAGKTEEVAGTGGGFRYARLGDPLFDAAGRVRGAVSFDDIARYLYYAEFGVALPEGAPGRGALVGVEGSTALYLLHDGVIDSRADGAGGSLTPATLDRLPAHCGPKIVYADRCLVGAGRLRREQVTFRQMPYELRLG